MDRCMASPCCEPRTAPKWRDENLLFKPGTQEFRLTVPTNRAEYEVVCSVICQ
jgi:hypothetical protein